MNRGGFHLPPPRFDINTGAGRKQGGMTLNDEIVICKECKKPEYWGKMRWLSGRCVCRDCYKANYEQDLDKYEYTENCPDYSGTKVIE